MCIFHNYSKLDTLYSKSEARETSHLLFSFVGGGPNLGSVHFSITKILFMTSIIYRCDAILDLKYAEKGPDPSENENLTL